MTNEKLEIANNLQNKIKEIKELLKYLQKTAEQDNNYIYDKHFISGITINYDYVYNSLCRKEQKIINLDEPKYKELTGVFLNCLISLLTNELDQAITEFNHL